MNWNQKATRRARAFPFLRSRFLFVATVWVFPALMLGLCLFSSAQGLQNYGTAGALLREIALTFRDSETQWMVFACLAVYLVTFMVLERRQCSGSPHPASPPSPIRWARGIPQSLLDKALCNADLWLAAGLVIAAVAYAFNYTTASKSTEALMLLGGVVVGKGAAVWAKWGRGEAESGKRKTEIGPASPVQARERRIRAVLGILVVLLLAVVYLRDEVGMRFQYRGQVRWIGPWDNPNIFGMLMGVGLVLAVGQILLRGGNIQHATFNIEHPTEGEEEAKPTAGNRHLTPSLSPVEAEREKSGVRSRWAVFSSWSKLIFFLAAAGVLSFGLIKSYSRGAWLATAVGLAYLAWNAMGCQVSGVTCHEERSEAHLPLNPHPQPLSQPLGEGSVGPGREGVSFSRRSCVSRLMSLVQRNWIPLATIFVSVFVIAFWNYRHTERVLAGRAFSVGHVNDFSSRNRLITYVGALQIMADKPLLGVGWNQPLHYCDALYKPSSLTSGRALWSNDYFMLGMQTGVPALICFLAYVGLALRRHPASSIQHPECPTPVTCHLSPAAICRAGAVVLLVGMWFDGGLNGGLFTFATGATFWILLEMGREV